MRLNKAAMLKGVALNDWLYILWQKETQTKDAEQDMISRMLLRIKQGITTLGEASSPLSFVLSVANQKEGEEIMISAQKFYKNSITQN